MSTPISRSGIHGHCECDRKYWRVVDWKCNHSAFNGYHTTPSDYSALVCLRCLHHWRTNAKYSYQIRSISEEEKRKWHMHESQD